MVVISLQSLGNLVEFPASIDSIIIPDHGAIGFILAFAFLFWTTSKLLDSLSRFSNNK